jgi:hypothetical protein
MAATGTVGNDIFHIQFYFIKASSSTWVILIIHH